MNFLSSLFGSDVPSVDAAGARARLDSQPQPLLLDVREPEEYREGHIPGALLIPLGDLSRRMGEIPHDRDIITVCHSGNRSGTAARQLAPYGYKVSNLRGGMIAWTRAGLPVKKGMGK